MKNNFLISIQYFLHISISLIILKMSFYRCFVRIQTSSTHCIHTELLNFWIGCQHVKCGFHINIKFSTFPGRRKVEIFAAWQLHPCEGSSTEQAAHGGWGLSFLAHPHPTPPRVPAGIGVFHAYSTFSSVFLSLHTGSHCSHSPAHFFLHSTPNCPFIIIFPPSESTGFLLELGVGQRGGVYPERLTNPLASWVAASRALGKLP